MKMRRIVCGLMATVLFGSLLFTGCGTKTTNDQAPSTADNGAAVSPSNDASASAATDKPVTVTFWAGTVTEERQELFNWFAQYVNQTYPNITLDMLCVPGSLDDYRQKLDVAIQAGTAPDITNDFRPGLVVNGYYENLNPYFDSWDQKDTINPELVKANKTYDPKGEGLYALPYSTQTWNMWVRPDWLKDIGMEVPTTWDDFFTAVTKMTDASKDRYGLAIRGGSGSANTLEMLMYAYSGVPSYFNPDGTCTINNPKNVEFVQKYLVDCYNVYTAQDDLTKGWSDLANAFQSGKAGIVIHNLGSASSMVKAFNEDYSKFQAAMFPVSAQGYIEYAGLMPLGISMNSQSKDKDAVWKVMQLYVSEEVDTKLGKLYGESPANLKSAQDPFFKESPYMQVGVNILTSPDVKFNDTPYYLPTYTNIQADMEANIQAVMSKKMSPQELLDTWAKALEEAHKDYKASVQ